MWWFNDYLILFFMHVGPLQSAMNGSTFLQRGCRQHLFFISFIHPRLGTEHPLVILNNVWQSWWPSCLHGTVKARAFYFLAWLLNNLGFTIRNLIIIYLGWLSLLMWYRSYNLIAMCTSAFVWKGIFRCFKSVRTPTPPIRLYRRPNIFRCSYIDLVQIELGLVWNCLRIDMVHLIDVVLKVVSYICLGGFSFYRSILSVRDRMSWIVLVINVIWISPCCDKFLIGRFSNQQVLLRMHGL